MGRHNLANTLAVIGAAHHLGVPAAAAAGAVETFAGVRRRQEVRGTAGGVTVMDDFAHHPTAVRETLRAVRPFYPDGRILAVFEPRTNTSMRDVFQNVYPEAFDAADAVWVRRPPLLEKIPEGRRFSSERLAADLAARGKAARCFSDTGGIVAHLAETARPGDLILVMSNGGFDNIHEKLLAALRSKSGPGPDLRS
jgi:UDP-N-acetylmuramate: L-alanyl-gamma-D-glutamyl-meso-diaminopimelate ligase